MLDIEPPRRESDRLTGEVMLLDKAYGNVWTNLTRAMVEEMLGAAGASMDGSIATVHLEVEFSSSSTGEGVAGARLTTPLVRTFGDVSEGAELAYFNSRDQLSFAVNMGDFAQVHGVRPGDRIFVRVAR